MSNADYSEFEGKKVILTATVDGEQVELEGTAETVNELAILFKPKGKAKLDIIEAENIVGVRYAPEKPKTLKAKSLLPIQYGQARQHLIDRHGYTLSDINAMTEEQAYNFHKELDHKASDLGHVHAAKEQTEAEAAVEAVESGETDSEA
jgi:hypothetical protein